MNYLGFKPEKIENTAEELNFFFFKQKTAYEIFT